MKKIDQLKRRIQRLDRNIELGETVESEKGVAIQAILDMAIPPCPNCQGTMGKYDFQKASRSPIGQIKDKPVYLHLRKRRFKCKVCSKILVAVTPIMGKTSQISVLLIDEIRKLSRKDFSISEISRRLPVSYTTVLRVLNRKTTEESGSDF